MTLQSNDLEHTVVGALDAYLNNDVTTAESLMGTVPATDDPFWKARIAIMYGVLEESKSNLDGAERYYSEAERIGMTDPGLADTAVGYALVSEAKSRLMLIKGIAYIIRNASVAEKYAIRALEIDPQNITAQLVFAQGKINAPRMFGGNPSLGIEIMEKVLQNSDQRSHRYTALYALSVAWEKKRRVDTALEMVNAALEIFPGSVEAREWRNTLLKKTRN